MIDTRHEQAKSLAPIYRASFETEWAGFFPPHTGRPATSPRLYLQHTYRLSGAAVVPHWVEKPYYQQSCAETFFHHRIPLDPSSRIHWYKRISEEGVEPLLPKVIEIGGKAGLISGRSDEEVIVGTMVME